MLGSLRYLGRRWTFDDLEEATSISKNTFRVFFKDHFIVVGKNILYPRFVQIPESSEEIEDCMAA